MLKRLKASSVSDNQALQGYLERLVKHLPREARAAQLAELREHLELLIAEQQARGLSQGDAQREALRRFGAPEPIARRLRKAWLGSPQGRAGSPGSALRFTLLCLGLPALANLSLVLLELALSGTTCKSPVFQQSLSLLLADYLTVHYGLFLPVLGFVPLWFGWQLRTHFQRGPVLAALALAAVLISLMCFRLEAMETLPWCQMMLCLGIGLLFRRQAARLAPLTS